MKKLVSFILIFVLLFSLGIAVFAEGGDGSGGGKDIPFGLDSSSIPDGSTDVSLDEDIVLNFNKNVVNFTVKENNMTCFSMKDSKGNAVPITVIMGDDQIDHEIRRIITIHPSSLSAGETYTLTISGNLKAKNGSSLGDDITLTFSTVKPTVTSTPTPSSTVKPTTSPSATSNSQTTVSPSTTTSASSAKTDNKSSEKSEEGSDSSKEKKSASGKAVEKEKNKQSSSLVVDEFSSEDSEDTSSRSHNQPVAIYIILGIILAAIILYAIASRNKNKKKDDKEEEKE